jgi:XTP/dITP diphosphohydrolase
MNKLVIASNNQGKIKEIQKLLDPLGYQVFSQSAFNVPEVEEPHATFIENALVKARHASAITKLPALSDDSGICVEALNGAPGVYSARFAGDPKSDERNNQKLLADLKNIANRKAYYYCVIVLVRYPDDPQPIIADGIWRGEILESPRGSGGFGYDPLFLDPQFNKTGAELTMEEKNRISHRGQALNALIAKLRSK